MLYGLHKIHGTFGEYLGNLSISKYKFYKNIKYILFL